MKRAATIVFVLGFASFGFGQSIPIANHSFEDQVLNDGAWIDGTLNGWNVTGFFAGPQNWKDDAYIGATDNDSIQSTLPDGKNTAFVRVSDMSISQTLNATIQPNTRYTMDYFVGHRFAGDFPSYRVDFLAGNTVIARNDTTVIPSSGLWVPTSLSFATGATSPYVGQPLSIRFGTYGPGDPPGKPGLVQLHIDNVRIKATSFAPAQTVQNAILQDSVSVNIDGPIIRAKFSPKNGMNLSQAAAALGVDHFNWVQYVTSHPPDIKYVRYSPPGPVSPQDPRLQTPFLDPDTDFPNTRIGVISLIPLNLTVNLPNNYVDKLPFYYNEDGPLNDFRIDARTDESVLRFADKPMFPSLLAAFFGTNRMHFQTSLVGVRSDGSYVTWDGLGTMFKWSSDTFFASDDTNGGFFFSTDPDDPSIPPAAGGGIREAVLDTEVVPEPATFILALLGLAAFTLRRAKTHSVSSLRGERTKPVCRILPR